MLESLSNYFAEAQDTKTVHIKYVLDDNWRKWTAGACCVLGLSLPTVKAAWQIALNYSLFFLSFQSEQVQDVISFARSAPRLIFLEKALAKNSSCISENKGEKQNIILHMSKKR